MEYIPTITREADLPITALTLLRGYQIRYHPRQQSSLLFDAAMVEEYCQLLVDGADLGRLEVVEEEVNGQLSGCLLLADGFQRFEAYRRLGRDTVPCRIRRGDELTGLLLAAHYNGVQSLTFSMADRLKVVQAVLEALAKRNISSSDTEIAGLVGLHPQTVAKVRQDRLAHDDAPIPRQALKKGSPFYSPPRYTTGYQLDPDLDCLPDADETIPYPSRKRTHRPRQNQPQPKKVLQRQLPIAVEVDPDEQNEQGLRDRPSEHQQLNLPFRDGEGGALPDGVSFVLGWRKTYNGKIQEQGVTNSFVTAEHNLPTDVQVAIIDWLQSRE